MEPVLPAEIIAYQPAHKEIFRKLNLDWLTEYNLVEDHDLMVLEDPEGIIINKGGVIFMARIDDRIIGSAALMKTGADEFELAKMSVDPRHRGRGISRQLMDACLEHARNEGARKISLFSNHKLTTAISLYEKYGFVHVPVTGSPFETADVRMERIL